MHYICEHHFIHTVTLLHVSALKGPSSESTDTFYEQVQQKVWPDVNIRLRAARVAAVTV